MRFVLEQEYLRVPWICSKTMTFAQSDLSQSLVMPSATLNAQDVRAVWTSDEGSMAKQTAETRWAKIIQGTVEDIGETAAAEGVDDQKRAESIAIQIALKDIKKSIEQNKALTYVPLLQEPKRQRLTTLKAPAG